MHHMTWVGKAYIGKNQIHVAIVGNQQPVHESTLQKYRWFHQFYKNAKMKVGGIALLKV